MLTLRRVASITSATQIYLSDLASSGDLNCDGFPDLVFQYTRDTMYVVFGNKVGFSSFDLPTKTEGVDFIKITRSDTAGDVYNFHEVKVIPDINGDGCADLISGIDYASGNNIKTAAYVLFGNKDFNKSDIDVSKITAAQGFSMSEVTPLAGTGDLLYTVQSLGDINKDGFNDFSVSSKRSSGAGEGYVIWGRDGKENPFTDIKFEGAISQQSKDWFKITGNVNQIIGVGDINGDGYADFAIAKDYLTYVMYGLRTGFYNFQPIDAKPPFGFTISSSALIQQIAPVGDVNNDKIDDFSVFSYCADTTTCAPSLQIVFGNKNGVKNFDLSKVPTGAGVKFTGKFGSALTKTFGVSETACDYNKDGIQDIVILHYGPFAGIHGIVDTHIVFGKAGLQDLDLDTMKDTDGVNIPTLPESLGSGSFLMGTCGDMDHRQIRISTGRYVDGGTKIVIYTRIFEFSDKPI